MPANLAWLRLLPAALLYDSVLSTVQASQLRSRQFFCVSGPAHVCTRPTPLCAQQQDERDEDGSSMRCSPLFLLLSASQIVRPAPTILISALWRQPNLPHLVFGCCSNAWTCFVSCFMWRPCRMFPSARLVPHAQAVPSARVPLHRQLARPKQFQHRNLQRCIGRRCQQQQWRSERQQRERKSVELPSFKLLTVHLSRDPSHSKCKCTTVRLFFPSSSAVNPPRSA